MITKFVLRTTNLSTKKKMFDENSYDLKGD